MQEDFHGAACSIVQGGEESPKCGVSPSARGGAAWAGHPHLRVIDNSTGFEDKIRRLIREISLYLGEPQPYEIERKFLIEYPDLNRLNNPTLKN